MRLRIIPRIAIAGQVRESKATQRRTSPGASGSLGCGPNSGAMASVLRQPIEKSGERRMRG